MKHHSLRKKCPNSELFWSAFFPFPHFPAFGLNTNTFYAVTGDKLEVIFYTRYTSSQLEVFLGKGVLKICSKFTGEHSCRGAISIKLQSMPRCDFNKVAKLLYWTRTSALVLSCKFAKHLFKTPFLENLSGWLLLLLVIEH